MMSRWQLGRGVLLALVMLGGAAIAAPPATSAKPAKRPPRPAAARAEQPAKPWKNGPVLWRDDFQHGLALWKAEMEKAGRLEAKNGRLSIQAQGGCTLWFRPLLKGPLAIEYDASVVVAGGPFDRLSDLNCFWMMRDARSPLHIFDVRRTGKFENCNQLVGYYAGYGGNNNTTSRFRRYIGDPRLRPLLPRHDLRDPAHLLKPNEKQRITLIAYHGQIEFQRNGETVFAFADPDPREDGWFAFRTVASHLEIENFRIRQLLPRGEGAGPAAQN